MPKFMRREFIVDSLAAALAPCLNGIATPSHAAYNGGGKVRYIDIHTHIGAFYHGRELTAELLVRFMDMHGIEKACVLPLISPEASPIPQPTAVALAAHRDFPDRIVPFCAVDPRCVSVPPRREGHVVGVKGLIEIIKRYQDAGCRGLGEHKTGLFFDDTQNMYLYEACTAVGLPILFHLDDIRNVDTPGLPRLERVLKEFPTLNLIGHAAGFWASISGDATLQHFGRYPKIPTPVTPGGALDRLLKQYPNLYCDLSEPGGYSAIARDRAFGRQFILRHANRLLFGTDVLMPDQQIPHFELFDSLELPEAVQQRVYRDNALKLLGLKQGSAG
jgi:predicted TIM-barrel fold metal-dependent hydrolase